jgi:endonuclease G
MKKKNFLATATLALALFTACSDHEGYNNSYPVAVQFTSTNISAVQTRVNGNNWESGDGIGIFKVNAVPAVLEEDVNKQYTTTSTSSSGAFTSVPGNAIYYPTNGSSVGFIAYYPYQSSITSLGTYPVNVANQTQKIDFLYAKTAVSYSNNTQGSVLLDFDHKLSKLVITTQKGIGIDNLIGLSVTIKGLNTKADFNLSAGTFGAGSDVANITPKTLTAPVSATDNGIYEAILLPEVTTGATVEFTIGANIYVWDLAASVSPFAANTQYNFTVTLNKTGVTINGNINPWSEITGTGTAQQ